MKKIVKNPQPELLIKWFKEERRENRDVSYEYGFKAVSIIENGEKKNLYTIVKESLLDEQGFLCCYTGKRIDLDSSHIEHLKPQSISKENRNAGIPDFDDVNYQNLLAAFPKKMLETDVLTGQKKHTECEFGAEARKDEVLPITPLDDNCEEKFSFNEFGEIKPTNNEDEDAIQTIKLLDLDNPRLKDERKNVIDAILLTEYLTEANVRRNAENAFERDGNRRFKPYCFVIKLACELRLRKIEKGKRVRRFAQQKTKRK